MEGAPRGAIIGFLAVIFAVMLGAGCDKPLTDMSRVPDGTYGEIRQAIAINTGPIIDCMPCRFKCLSNDCVTSVCLCTGACSIPVNKADGTPCDDGNMCTTGDACQAGSCTGAGAVTCPGATDVCHVAGTCSPATGCSPQTNAPDGTNCDDGNQCNGVSTCQVGTCAAGTPVTCTAIDRCHVAGTCNPANGTCTNPLAADGADCDDGNKCNGIETCHTGTCTAGTAVVCAASDRCHLAGTCNPANGTCTNPAASDGTSCDDGNKCNGIETCKSGVCGAGTAVTCTVQDRCHALGMCNPATGTCSNPALADGMSCDDGNKCNGIETCKSGLCGAGTAVTCLAQDGCHKVGTCDPATGTCSQPLAPDGLACGANNKCSGGSACKAGVCTAGAPVGCPALDKCHGPGMCDPASGTCTNPALPDGTDCDNGDMCDGPDLCQSGVCTSGPAVVCAPPDNCQTATCLRASGVCAYAPTGNCSPDAGTPDGPMPGEDAPVSIPDAAGDVRPGGDGAPSDRPIGSGGAPGSVDAAGGHGGGAPRVGAVIGPCSYSDGGGLSSRAPIVLWAVVAVALRRRRRGRG